MLTHKNTTITLFRITVGIIVRLTVPCQCKTHVDFKIMQQSNDSVVVYVCGEIKPTIEKLFDKIGIFSYRAQNITTMEDRNTFITVVDKVF